MNLIAESLDLDLHELLVPDELVPELAQLVRAVSQDESVADRVAELVDGLTAQIEDVFSRESLFVPSDFMIGPGRGSVPLLALLKVRHAVDQFWQGRYYPEDIRRATAAEIGRQVEVTHRVHGWVGLTDAKWIEILFRGGFAQVGRLQFELMHDEYRVDYGLNTHISAVGHLDLDAVRDSFTRGRELFARAFPTMDASRWRAATPGCWTPSSVNCSPTRTSPASAGSRGRSASSTG